MSVDDLSDRMARSETNIETLTNDVRTITNSVGDLTREFRVAIESLNTKFHENNKTPWGILASWLALAVGIMSIIGAFYVRDLGRVEEDVRSNGIAILTHIQNSPSSREIQLKNELLQLHIDNLTEKLNNKK